MEILLTIITGIIIPVIIFFLNKEKINLYFIKCKEKKTILQLINILKTKYSKEDHDKINKIFQKYTPRLSFHLSNTLGVLNLSNPIKNSDYIKPLSHEYLKRLNELEIKIKKEWKTLELKK